MFKIEVEDPAPLMDKFYQAEVRIISLEQEVGRVMFDWQREDMKRKYLSAEVGPFFASTMVYPRSRTWRKPGQKGGARAVRKRVARARAASSKPILRPELFDKLKDRMVTMCEEALKWQ